MSLRILIIDNDGSGLDWAMRAQADGHDIRWYIRPRKDGRRSEVGDGFIDKIEDYRSALDWCDFVLLTDNAFYMKEMDHFRNRGGKVFGPTEMSAELELDRLFGQEALKTHGIPVIPAVEFHNYDDAIRFVKKEGKRYVSKPCGDADKALTYVSKSPADMVYMLERWKKSKTIKSEFLLQEFVPGIEMAVGGWFGPGGWSGGWCENFEFKKLMNDDLGCNTGEQGTTVRIVKKSKLAEKVLFPMTGLLHRMRHTGYIDVNCIIDEHGTPWPLEFTSRLGWPLFNIQQSLFEGDHAQWMKEILDGRRPDPWVREEISVGVVMSIPDYPYSHLTNKEVSGIPVYGLKPSILPNCHLCEMRMGTAPTDIKGKVMDAPIPVTAGDYLLVMTGTGPNVKSAKSQAYSRLKSLMTPGSPGYRTDIGNRLKRQIPELQKHGYAHGMAWM